MPVPSYHPPPSERTIFWLRVALAFAIALLLGYAGLKATNG